MTRTVYFIGVATSGSSIHALFPRWMEGMGIDARIEGIDLPLGAHPDRYRDVVHHIAADPQVAGAVITSHKLGMYAAARDLYAGTDRFVPLCREVSAISKDGDALYAHAPDALAARATIESMLGSDYWANHATDVLCLGAGGAATAIALCLLVDLGSMAAGPSPAPAPPRRLLFVDIDQDRLSSLQRMVETVNGDARVEYLCHADPHRNDALLTGLHAGSLVINATGMGKDRPGSPLTDAAVFPGEAIVWDLNYRGEMRFIQQAWEQQEGRRLKVHDGWLFFLYGWSHCLSAVLHTDFSRLASAVLPQPT